MGRLANRPPRTPRPRARSRAARLVLADLEARIAPAAPPAPPGYTATLTAFANSTPVAITEDGTPTVTSTITVSGAATYLHDIDLTTFLKHSWADDLDITLTSPAGTVVTITSDNASFFDDVFDGTLWDDDADPGNPGPFAGDTIAASKVVRDAVYEDLKAKPALTPEEPLAAFVGENPNGTWILAISDDADIDGGSLNQWKLDLTTLNGTPALQAPAGFTNGTSAAVGANVGTTTSAITVSGANPYLQKLTLRTFLTHTSNSQLDVTLTSPAGTSVTITTDNAGSNDDVFNGTLWDDDADPGNPAPFPADVFAGSKLVGDTVYANGTAVATLVPEEPLGAFIGENPNGVWTLRVHDDSNGEGGTLASWALNVTGPQPGPIPAAFGSSPSVTGAGATSHPVSVVLVDDTGINVGTVINNSAAVRVTGPNGFDAPATYVGIDTATNGSPRTATYTFTPPGGSWDAAERGTYTLAVRASQVADTGGTFVPAGVIGSFTVFVPNFTVRNTADAGFGSLRQALDDANVVPGPDTVTFDPAVFNQPRTISLQSALPQITDAVSLTGPGAGQLTVRRDPGAAASFRVFDSTAPALTITGMTVSGGATTAFGDGGGLLAMGTAPVVTLDRVVFSGNSAAGEGGAVYVTAGGLLALRNSTLSGNTAASAGGAVYFYGGGSLLMENSTVTGNTAGGGTGGGGFYFFGTPTATPPAPFVGFAHVIRNSTISNNSAGAGAGGGVVWTSGGTNATLLVQNSTISGNTAATSGGGIGMTTYASGALRIENSTVVGNTANGSAAGTGGGGVSRLSTAANTLTVLNSIVAGNSNANAPDILTGATGTTANINFSAIGTAAGYTPSGTSGNNLAPGTDLKLGALAANGGPTLTVAPLPASPLVDKGSTADVPGGVTTDQRGQGFVRVFGDAVDIGAFEVQPPAVTINQAAGQADPTGTPSAAFDVRFTVPVTGFDAGDVDLSDTTAAGTLVAAVSGSGAAYTVTVTGLTGPGAVVAKVRAGAAADAFGTGNLASTSTDNSVTYDAPGAEVTIDQAAGQADPTAAGPIAFTVVFNEPVTGFDESDVVLGGTVGGTLAAAVTGSGPAYTVTVTGMTGNGTVVASVRGGAAVNAIGDPSHPSTSTDNVVAFDTAGPSVTINQAAGQPDPGGSSIKFDVAFDEPVTGFIGADVDLSGSTTGGGLAASVTGSGAAYTVTVTGMAGAGVVIAKLPAGAVTDLAGNASAASTSTDNEVTFDAVAPTVTINQGVNQTDPGGPGPVVFDVVFSEPATGFTGADVSFAGSTVGGTLSAAVAGTGTHYTVTVTGMVGNGTVVASIPAGGATDGAENPSEASTSTDNSVGYQDSPGQFQFASAAYAASEIGGAVTVTVTRAGGAGGPVSVGYATGGGTAAVGADYLTATGTLSWANGETGSKSFTVTIQDDALVEGPETIGLALSNPTGGAALGNQAAAEVQIADFEQGVLAFESPVITVEEGAGTIKVLVTRTSGTDGVVSVAYATVDGTAHSGGAAATGQDDYTPVNGTLSWAAGEGGTKEFVVPILSDTFSEGREAILLQLSNPTGGAVAGPDGMVAIRPSNPRPAGLFLDDDGDVVTVKLAGPGKAQYYLADPDGDSRGALELVELSGTSVLTSVLSVAVARGPLPADGKVSLGGVSGTEVKSIAAPKANLTGDGINLTGPVTSVVVGDVMNGADILAGGAPPLATRITAGVIADDTTIQVGRRLAALTATKIGDGQITAPSIGTLTVKGKLLAGIVGSMASDIDVSGTGLLVGQPAVGTIAVAGPIDQADVDVKGRIGSLRAKGFTGGKLTTASIGTMVVTGNLTADMTVTGVGVATGKPALTGLSVTGEVKGADIAVTGNVSAITVGAFRDSRLYVNYDPTTAEFGPAATVGAFRVTGPVDGFQDADVFAPTLKVVVLKSLDQTNDELFGFTADLAVGSLRVLTGSLFIYDPTDPGEQGPDQFKVRIV